MNKKIFITGSVILAFALLIFIAAISKWRLFSPETSPKVDGMAFEVMVPKNTLEDDTVHIFFQNQKNYKMEKKGNGKFYKKWLRKLKGL